MESDTHLLYLTKLSGKSQDFYFLVGIHLKVALLDHLCAFRRYLHFEMRRFLCCRYNMAFNSDLFGIFWRDYQEGHYHMNVLNEDLHLELSCAINKMQ